MQFKHILIKGIIIQSVCTLLFVSCSKNKENLLSEKSFINISGELMIINHLSVSDSVKAILYNNTFKKYEIPSSTYKKTLSFYKKNPKKWVNIYNKIKAEIDKKDSKSKK